MVLIGLFIENGIHTSFEVAPVEDCELRLEASKAVYSTSTTVEFSVSDISAHTSNNLYGESTIEIFPNPASDYVHVLWNHQSMLFDHISIKDLSGKII
ncbi:MAG: hypothetical protein ACK4GL_03085 [Flavobacteriales bacterium]